MPQLCRNLGAARHAARDGSHAEGPLTIAGPLYTGPLHDGAWLEKAAEEAHARGWVGHSYGADAAVKLTGPNPQRPLEELLDTLIEESDPRLPPWLVTLRSIAEFGTLENAPGRDALIERLRVRGFAACRSHVEVRLLWRPLSMC